MRLMRHVIRIPDCHGEMSSVGGLTGFDSTPPYEPAEQLTVLRVKQAAVGGRQFDQAIALLVFVAAVVAAAAESVVAIEFVVNVAVGVLSGRLHCWPSYSLQTDY